MAKAAFSPTHVTDLPPAKLSQARCRRLETQITELSAHIHAATCRLLELIREYDNSKGWAGPGLNSCAHWLNWKCGINLGAARESPRGACLGGLAEDQRKVPPRKDQQFQGTGLDPCCDRKE